MFALCINTKAGNDLHPVKTEFKRHIFTLHLPTHLQKDTLHPLSLSHIVQLSMYAVLKKVQPPFQNPAKNIFMNQFTKTRFRISN